MESARKNESYGILKEPYIEFRLSITDWREYEECRERLFRSIENIVSNKESLLWKSYNAVREILREKYDERNADVQRFLRILEAGVGWSLAEEERILKAIDSKRKSRF